MATLAKITLNLTADCSTLPKVALVVGKSYLTDNGKIARIKSASPFIADVTNADGSFNCQTFYRLDGASNPRNKGLDIESELCSATLCALDWLAAHGQKILGVTPSGVCVKDQYCSGAGYTLWLPAKRSALRDFMNY